MLTGLALIIGTSILELVRRVRLRGDDAARGREFLLAVMNSAAEGIVSLDGKGRVQYANPAGCALLGYTPDEIRGENFHALVHHTRADGSPFPDQESPINATLVDGIEQEVDDDVFWRRDESSFPVSYKSAAIDSRSNDGVVITFTDISERRRIEEIKDELVSVVSHELRTPLTSIRGSLGLIAGGAVGEIPAEAERMIGIAVANTDRLVRLINEILDLERIESGRVELSRRLCDSDELMQHAAATMAAQAEAAGTRIEVERSWVLLWADPDRITQTLINLLSNAVKYSPPGVPVVLRAVRADSEVRFDVIDRGRGIPAENLESVFERFRQVDASDSRDKGGTGLGLPIARSIVHQHGGRIWAESAPGEGTTVSFTLPAVATGAPSRGRREGRRANGAGDRGRPRPRRDPRGAPARRGTQRRERARRDRGGAAARHPPTRPDRARPLAPGRRRGRARDLDAQSSRARRRAARRLHGQGPERVRSRPPAARAEPACDQRARRAGRARPARDGAAGRAGARARDRRGGRMSRRVLIVDDEADILEVARMSLESVAGWEVLVATGGREATELVRTERPDAVLLDVMMPDLDGPATLALIREHSPPETLPALFLTAKAHAFDAERLERLRPRARSPSLSTR